MLLAYAVVYFFVAALLIIRTPLAIGDDTFSFSEQYSAFATDWAGFIERQELFAKLGLEAFLIDFPLVSLLLVFVIAVVITFVLVFVIPKLFTKKPTKNGART